MASTLPPDSQPPPANAARPLSRRSFLYQMAGAGSVLIASRALEAADMLAAIRVDNPLAAYPDRGWERVYRDLWKSDSSFTFLCAPNDTHNCLLNAYVRNGVVTRIGPTMRYGEATDLERQPRQPPLGSARLPEGAGADAPLLRRPPRASDCMVRAGFKQWVDDGLPARRGRPAAATSTSSRGRDEWVRVAARRGGRASSPRRSKNIAETYTGEEGKQRLRAQHYDPAMVEATQGAGTQVLKFRGGMPLLGMTRVFGMYRLANSMALLDAQDPQRRARQGARRPRLRQLLLAHRPAARPPDGHRPADRRVRPERRRALPRRVVVWGMNWITTKMPDAHWLTEARLKGTQVVVIACEYSATATQGRRRDRRAARHDAGAGARARPRDPAREALRRRLRASSGPTCRSWCAWTR